MLRLSYFVFPNGKEILMIASLYWVHSWQRFGTESWEPIDIADGMFGYTNSVEIGEFSQVVI